MADFAKGSASGGPRRFYAVAEPYPLTAEALAEEGHAPGAALFGVALDGKPVRAPGGRLFACPEAVAAAAAAEWASAGDRIDPRAMPVTRAVNTALERVAPQREAVIADIAAYVGSDLLCYRAEGPDPLILREAEGWDPILEWAAARYEARLILVVGVTPVAQPSAALRVFHDAVAERGDLALVALHELTTLSGSLLLALAVAEERLAAEEAWTLSRIDEDWQSEQWGVDAEAEAAAEIKRRAFGDAARLLSLLKR